MSGSSNGKLIAAGLGGALVMLAIGAVIWPKAPEAPAGAPPAPTTAPPPAAETAAPAALVAEAAPEPAPAPAAATTAEWPDVPEVGQAAPSAPPPLRFPTNNREREAFVADAVRDIGDVAVQRSLRSARWTFDANVPPVRGRILVDVNDEVAVLRIPELDTVATQRNGRCMRRAGGLVSDCERHEEQILQVVTTARQPILLGAWLQSGAKVTRSSVGHELGAVEIGVAPPGGQGRFEVAFLAQGTALRMATLDSLPTICKSMLLQAHRTVGGLTLPSVWQFATTVPQARPEPPAQQAGQGRGDQPGGAQGGAPGLDGAQGVGEPGGGAPPVTSTGESADDAHKGEGAREPEDPATVQKRVAFCAEQRLLLVDVVPITVTVPKLEPLAAESEPRIEKRLVQRLRALAVESADTIFPAIGNVMNDPNEIDRRRGLLGLVVGKDGLAVATPIVDQAPAQAPIQMAEVPVIRQRISAKPTLLVARMQEFAATVGKSHKIAEGPWIAWLLNVDTKVASWSTTESVFEFEIPIAP